MTALQPGRRAPDFTLPNQDGQPVTLATVLQSSVVVLFFYPKDDTPVCTREACTFRDTYDDFVEAGATVIGISSDSAQSHRRFADKHGLPFTLVSDAQGDVRALYRVPNTLFVLPGRTTFVIGRDGTIRHTFSSARNAERHVHEALAAVRREL